MEQLTVIGVENGSVMLGSSSGESYAVSVEDIRALRLSPPTSASAPHAPGRARPRDIQAQIRAGLSAAETAEILGIPLEDVLRYERPVIAEREFIVGQALAVPVMVSSDFDPETPTTFGDAVRAKLAEAHATDESWTSWKDETGWVVKLGFTVSGIARDARWNFDPKRSMLAPANDDATQLSRQGSLPEGIIPRLRALDPAGVKDDSRFDSGAFTVSHDPDELTPAVVPAPAPAAVQEAAIKRAPETIVTPVETADLLEALRRRRGQRTEAPLSDDEQHSAAPMTPVPLFEAGEPESQGSVSRDEPSTESQDAARRRGRPSMPSWDEIVFGARTDES